MTQSLSDLHAQLQLDPLRQTRGFSADFMQEQERIIFANSRDEAAAHLQGWLQSHQPCLFGRYAAGTGIAVCVIREDDLDLGDAHVASVIKKWYRGWQVAALRGQQHSFIVLVTTERLAWAEPGPALLAFAQRILKLYLNHESVDDVAFDELFLETRDENLFFRWENGTNFFASQGDGRWWHDHRIPGGIAFATNVVGHMAFTQLKALRKCGPMDTQVHRLANWALPVAMTTIRHASKNKAGLGGSYLLERKEGASAPFCAHAFPELAGKDWRTYGARFHTDHTLPSSFFHSSDVRPSQYQDHTDLDFSYLHVPSEADHVRIGLGELADPEVNTLLREILKHAEDLS